MDHIIDAKNKRLGRLASDIAVILQGKHKASYEPRLAGTDRVIVKNIKKVTLSGNKTTQKIYYRHAGALGHLKKRSYREVFAKKPSWVLRNAVRLMLPKNRLQRPRLRRLIIEI